MGAVSRCIPVDILGGILQGGSSLGWASGRNPHGRGSKESRTGHSGKWDCVRVVTEIQSHAKMELRLPLEMCSWKTRELSLLLSHLNASGVEVAPELYWLSQAKRHF